MRVFANEILHVHAVAQTEHHALRAQPDALLIPTDNY
jgi:hypothetical protein